MKWEYKYIDVDAKMSYKKTMELLHQELNKMGEEGWELVNFAPILRGAFWICVSPETGRTCAGSVFFVPIDEIADQWRPLPVSCWASTFHLVTARRASRNGDPHVTKALSLSDWVPLIS